VPKFGSWYLGGSTNRATYRRSWFLSKLPGGTISHTSNFEISEAQVDAEPRHGPSTVYDEALHRSGSTVMDSWFKTLFMSFFLMVSAGLYVSSTLVRTLLEKFIPQPGQGPSMAVCERGWTRVTNVSESDGDKPLTVVTQYTAKGDPGYSHTAKILAEMALSLILAPPKGTKLPPLATVGGVLTPSTAGGSVLIERLRKNGVAQIESQIVAQTAGEAKKTI
jgi:hypothetical protein